MYILIRSQYDQNSDTSLQAMLEEPLFGTAGRMQPCPNTAGFCPVRVTTPLRQSRLGFWTVLEPNSTGYPVQPGPPACYPEPLLTLSSYSIRLKCCRALSILLRMQDAHMVQQNRYYRAKRVIQKPQTVLSGCQRGMLKT